MEVAGGSNFSFNFSIVPEGAKVPQQEKDEANIIGLQRGLNAACTEDNENSTTVVNEPRHEQEPLPLAFLVPLDEERESVDIKFPSSVLEVPLRSPLDRCPDDAHDSPPHLRFVRIDEERVEISEKLGNTLHMAGGGTGTDLIPNVYEGGLTIWECSLDLVRYLHNNHDDIFMGDKNGSNRAIESCLDLGCGHGLTGIYVLSRSEAQVCFSDFNEDVLRHVTWPNVLMNVTGDRRFNATYFAGDWNSLHAALEVHGTPGSSRNKERGETVTEATGKFDLILTAETCYTEKSCREVAQLIKSLLKNPSARAFVAAKRYYFGTGGSTGLFQSECTHIGLQVQVVDIADDGRSSIREIYEVRLSP